MKLFYNLISKILLILLLHLTISIYTYSQVTPGDPNAVSVEFRFTYDLSPSDSGIGLNGSMNDWLNGIYRMHLTENNLWKLVLHLQPKTYDYKFVRYVDTVGQDGVTGYFSDPLNSKIGGPFLNSMIEVKDPMIYYFLPKDGSTLKESPVIMANFAVANKSQFDASKIFFSIDGVEIPNANSYYNAETKQFIYNPPQPPDYTSHTAYLKIYNTAGDFAELSTTFEISADISTAPYTFIFDSKSPGFNFLSTVNTVDVKGPFNFEGLDAMKDSAGVFSITKELEVGKPTEYTYIINGGSYINDPDNPILSSKHRTQVIKQLTSRPSYSNFDPPSGMIYTSPVSSVQIKAHIDPSDSGYAINPAGSYATYNGKIVRFTKIPSGNGFDVVTSIANPVEGRHVLEIFGKDEAGISSLPAAYVFGVYPEGSGYHYVDGENDDKGPGYYTYPGGIPPGSADIQSINIVPSSSNDSLIFTIGLKKISDYTRIGFEIVNFLKGEYVDAFQDVDLRIPEWNGRGVFLILSSPVSPFYESESENVLYVSRDPITKSIPIVLDETAVLNNQFKFAIPLSELENVMGTYKSKWHFTVYSYFKNQSGPIEVEPGQNAYNYEEDTDVYDAAFFSDQKIQERLLANFRSAEETGGSRLAVIGSEERGSAGISSENIDPAFGNSPEVKIYADGGDLIKSPVLVRGYAGVSANSSVTISNNGNAYQSTTDAQKEFEFLLPLTEGQNKISASVNYGSNLTAISKPIVYNYIVDHKPTAKIYSQINQSTVTLYADSSYDPDGTNLSLFWIQDDDNPQKVTLSNSTNLTTSFTTPKVNGEYYFTLKVTDAENDTGWARTVINIEESVVSKPDLAYWHPAWVDSTVMYSIFVRTFDASGTFTDVTNRMQELADLGIGCIWFLPIHPSTGNMGPDNPGYAITNYLEILSDYGTKEDFKKLVNIAHQYGIKIILDHVIQHTSDLHPFMKDANKYKSSSPYYPFYTWDQNDNFKYLFTWVDLPSINYSSEDTRNYLIKMSKYWVQEFNLDGYRCDAAWAIDSLRAEGSAFWQKWRSELKSIKPDIFLLAEGNAWQTKLFNKKFDVAYDWNWYGAIKGVITGTQTIDNLNNVINSYYTAGFPDHALPFKFIENQDEQRFIDAYGIANTRAAAAHMLTAPGIPMLYAGQEVGEISNRGNINWNDPHALRDYYKHLIYLRKNIPALAYGDFTRINNSEPGKVYSYLRTNGESNTIVHVNFNSSNVQMNINVPIEKLSFDSLSTFYLNDELNKISLAVKGTDLKNFQVNIAPNSALIFELSSNPLTEIEDDNQSVPKRYDISQNYPNPFNPSTTIKYALPYLSHVKITIFNILGQRVTELVNTVQSAGNYSAVWNAINLSSGIYMYAIEANSINGKENFTSVKKMVLVK